MSAVVALLVGGQQGQSLAGVGPSNAASAAGGDPAFLELLGAVGPGHENGEGSDPLELMAALGAAVGAPPGPAARPEHSHAAFLLAPAAEQGAPRSIDVSMQLLAQAGQHQTVIPGQHQTIIPAGGESVPGDPGAATGRPVPSHEAAARQMPLVPIPPAMLSEPGLRARGGASWPSSGEALPGSDTARQAALADTPHMNRHGRPSIADAMPGQPKGGAEMALGERTLPPVPMVERIATSAATIQEFGEDPAGQLRLALPVSSPMAQIAGPEGALPQAFRAAMPAMAAEIVSQLRGGNRHFEIRLDPPELGRIEVKLDFRPDGSLMARLVVERPETLDLLMRDARGLEKTLQASGLKLEEGGLDYQLRDQSAFERHGRQSFSSAGQSREEAPDGEERTAEGAQPQHWRPVLAAGIDIRV